MKNEGSERESDVLLLERDVRLKNDYCIELYDPFPQSETSVYGKYVCCAEPQCVVSIIP